MQLTILFRLLSCTRIEGKVVLALDLGQVIAQFREIDIARIISFAQIRGWFRRLNLPQITLLSDDWHVTATVIPRSLGKLERICHRELGAELRLRPRSGHHIRRHVVIRQFLALLCILIGKTEVEPLLLLVRLIDFDLLQTTLLTIDELTALIVLLGRCRRAKVVLLLGIRVDYL